MAHQVPWDKIILEEFIRLGALTETEEMIMRTRVAGMSRVEQSLKFGLSVASIDRAIASCKKKYDAVEQYSYILPPRKR